MASDEECQMCHSPKQEQATNGYYDKNHVWHRCPRCAARQDQVDAAREKYLDEAWMEASKFKTILRDEFMTGYTKGNLVNTLLAMRNNYPSAKMAVQAWGHSTMIKLSMKNSEAAAQANEPPRSEPENTTSGYYYTSEFLDAQGRPMPYEEPYSGYSGSTYLDGGGWSGRYGESPQYASGSGTSPVQRRDGYAAPLVFRPPSPIVVQRYAREVFKKGYKGGK